MHLGITDLVWKGARRALAVPNRMPGYLAAVRRLHASRVAIVMYHGVVADPLPVWNWCQVHRDEFKLQIEFLAAEYNVLPLDEVVDRLRRSAPLPPRVACLTFDDGFRNVATTAFPILEQYQIPSTIFLVTGVVGTNQPAWPDILFHALATTKATEVVFDESRWPLQTPDQRSQAFGALVSRLIEMQRQRKDDALTEIDRQLDPFSRIGPESPLASMNWDEVDRLAKTGLVNFGSHTHTHQILARCEAKDQETELRASRDILIERLGSAELFAYPNGGRGDFTEATGRLLERLGYRCGLTTIPGLNKITRDLYTLKRVNVGADTSLHRFELLMAGL
ncbi:polysaccharide deacetylase family protein [Tautonia sp. JC769]|uniref:polysaccharide deacetylase family protein n=1 Tax=Tautonia sp. JC769 TaxID=3232135 RepID=UPI00345AE894